MTGRAGPLGVTGHRGRPLPGADERLLRDRVDGVLAGVAALGIRELISPLAEGADRLVAHRALEAGWCIRALLPFDAPRYEEDFSSSESTGEFRQLLQRASAVEVVPEAGSPAGGARSGTRNGTRTPIDDTLGATSGDAPLPEGDPDLPYRRVGEALLDRVAVLVAVWNGEPPRGPGGTGEVVERGRLRGIPVIWIHAAPPHGIRLLEPGVPGARVVGADSAGALPSLLGRWLGRGAP